ncbi:MAG: General secretion pathway protein GspL [Candidatus Gallionella acididurans]|uniref:General secretion pathway protein GspL n=1 Tax=Candidatus Gallionella acididurans TaxID=1796491 RepID=A0A139BVB2_9PROT|nr:MAG: General secretion pathway protein GspL [Candidatus Gallionella acididurans]
MSTLYIRLPSKAAADSASHWPALPCMFALVSNGNLSHDNAIERQGTAPLSDLSDTVAKAQRVVVMLAGSDVTVLRMQIPPLSAAKLKAALPNLVEDQLIADPDDCVVVAGGMADGLRTIAVVQRTWIELLTRALRAFGARHITVLPAQLCLPCQADQPGSVIAAINDRNDGDRNAGIDMTLRLSEQEGIGLAITHEKDDSAAAVAIRTLCAVVPENPVILYVPQSMVRAYQEVVNDAVSLNKRISVFADNWSRWITGANLMKLDLAAGLVDGAGTGMDWRPWRWPLALAGAILIINLLALNIDWWHMKNESSSLRAAMLQIYKSAYPKESVIIDPVAQMHQKIAAAKHDAGLAAPDDFTAITAALGEAWASVAQAAAGKPAIAIAALEYHDHSLFVRLKPAGDIPTQQMKVALAKFELALDLAPAESGAVVWKIRSAK